jgi:ribosomal protein L7/L12
MNIKSTTVLPCGTEIVISGTMENVIRVLQALRNAEVVASIPQVSRTAEARDEVRRCLDRGRKIEAIKIYRGMCGTSLKEAKEVVDLIISQEYPSLSYPNPY